MMKRFLLIGLITGFIGACEDTATDASTSPPPGNESANDLNVAGAGVVNFRYDPLSRDIPIWYYVPEDNPGHLPILLVLHGTNRTADSYRDNWIPLSIQHKVIIIAPEFSDRDFPGSRSYNLGNLFDQDGSSVSEERWTFSIIDPIFDFVVSEIDGNQETYDIFGHSAGGQFVHRFLTFKADAKAHRFIAANAGWYTLADVSVEFPYGLSSTHITQEDLGTSFNRELIILLGEADTVRDSNLRTTVEADAQGPHRLARGQFYFSNAESTAKNAGMEFKWILEFAPGVGHSNREIAPFAADILY